MSYILTLPNQDVSSDDSSVEKVSNSIEEIDDDNEVISDEYLYIYTSSNMHVCKFLKRT